MTKDSHGNIKGNNTHPLLIIHTLNRNAQEEESKEE
jgi:hypothetical protein